MTKDDAVQFLKVLGATKIDLGSLPWVHGNCPLARYTHQKGYDQNPSFGILTGKSRARCHCFSCNTSGSPNEILGLILLHAKGQHGYDIRAAEKIIEGDGATLDLSTDEDARYDQSLMEFPETFWQSFPQVSDEARAYLNGRGVTDKEIVAHDIRWDGLSRRVCVPVRGFDGLLYGVRGRAIDKTNSLRYLSYPFAKITNPQVWLGEHDVDFEQPILVVEASFQYIAARRVWKNTVAPLSAGLHLPQAKRMGSGFCFVHLFDGDKAGRAASKKLKEFLPEATHVRLDLPDDCGPDDLPFNELQQIIAMALPV